MHKVDLKSHKDADIFFTADEHYYHFNIIKYCKRSFRNIEDMNKKLINMHNSIVSKNSVVIHLGDFSLGGIDETIDIIESLNGRHIFLQGSHDKWLRGFDRIPESKLFLDTLHDILQVIVSEGPLIVCCHYAMRIWPSSHHGSWHVFGHSHGTLPPQGKSVDVGVDSHHFMPVSLKQLKDIMEKLPDNIDLV